MGAFIMAVLELETIPVGILICVARIDSLRRRSRFWMRFAGLVICVTLPDLVGIIGSQVGLGGGEKAAGVVLWGGFLWGLPVVALARLLLFQGPGPTPGPSDDGSDGPGPRDDRPSPPRPIGGVPLPDAEQSSIRDRGPHPRRRAPNRSRPAREPKRTPPRVWPLFPWPRTPSPNVG